MSVLLTCTDCGKEFETAWGHETETCDACSGRSRGPPERLPYLDP